MGESKYLTLKLQLYPNSRMKHLMDRSIEVSGYVYNAFIYVGKYYRKKYNCFPSKNDLRGLCTRFWKNCPWMHDVANNCFFECADNAIRSLKCCRERYIQHKGSELPRYRPREKFQGFGHLSCTNFHLNSNLVNDKLKRTLSISKIGNIRARNNQAEPPGLPKTCHIKRELVGNHHEYYATISYKVDENYSKDEVDLEDYPKKPQGMDIGIFNVATLSDGTIFTNNKHQKNVSSKLELLHRQFVKSEYDSKRHQKTKAKLSHLYRKIANKRKNDVYEYSRKIVYRHGQIYAESLSINQIRSIAYSHSMKQQYDDACLGELLKRIEILSNTAGRPLKYVEYAHTSQECSRCGKIVIKKLEVRTHKCPECGLVLDRDVNAAINILKRGLASNPEASKNSTCCTWFESKSNTCHHKILENTSKDLASVFTNIPNCLNKKSNMSITKNSPNN